ncbi:MAG: cytochrome-c peroxidase [Myxococcales bacterium]|nr:cytochrome-c peroxidase [Myxococcota bacterium]MDW8283451.1 cytochrome-c peroxidase [Myxococcales bacterium]
MRSLFTLGILVAVVSCQKKEAPPPPAAGPAAEPPKPTAAIDPGRLGLFQPPLPAAFESPANPLTEEKIALGRMLYYDKRLSKNHDISCNSCHDLARFGVDNQKVSPGHRKQLGSRNSPSVYNAAGHFAQFWDGRAPTVEEQAKGPVLNPVEMAMPNEQRVLATLRSMPAYVAAFRKAFPADKDPITWDNMARAIGAFERKLVTPARWDRFLAGEADALSEAEKIGFNTFVQVGCPTCHLGTLVGGTQYQKAGLVVPWPEQKDQGRYEVTKQEGDRMLFKVPSLRNVARTAPYFHDGSVATLEEAVRRMARHQLGKELSEQDTSAIVTWLQSLTGEIPQAYIQAPELPPSTAKTPKPDPS